MGELTQYHVGKYVSLGRIDTQAAGGAVYGTLQAFTDERYVKGVNVRPGRSVLILKGGRERRPERFGPYPLSAKVILGRPRREGRSRQEEEPYARYSPHVQGVRVYFRGGPLDGKIHFHTPEEMPEGSVLEERGTGKDAGILFVYTNDNNDFRVNHREIGHRYTLRGLRTPTSSRLHTFWLNDRDPEPFLEQMRSGSPEPS